MTKLVMIAMFTIGGLFGVLRIRAVPSQVPDPAPAHVQAVAAPNSEPATDDAASCDNATVSEDAADCFAGGWTPMLICCGGSIPQERWTLGTRVKCCGPCFQ
jgi:hypothetical protein